MFSFCCTSCSAHSVERDDAFLMASSWRCRSLVSGPWCGMQLAVPLLRQHACCDGSLAVTARSLRHCAESERCCGCLAGPSHPDSSHSPSGEETKCSCCLPPPWRLRDRPCPPRVPVGSSPHLGPAWCAGGDIPSHQPSVALKVPALLHPLWESQEAACLHQHVPSWVSGFSLLQASTWYVFDAGLGLSFARYFALFLF